MLLVAITDQGRLMYIKTDYINYANEEYVEIYLQTHFPGHTFSDWIVFFKEVHLKRKVKR